MGLTSRLFLLALVALVPTIALQVYDVLALRTARSAEVSEASLRQAQLAASEVDRILEGVRNLLLAAAAVPGVRDGVVPDCTGYLEGLRRDVSHLVDLATYDSVGRLQCGGGPAVAAPAILQATLASDRLTIGTYEETASGDPILPLSLPLGGADETGIIVASLDLDWLGEQLRIRGYAEGGSITLADRTGMILARQPAPDDFVGTRIPDAFIHLVTGEAPGTLELTSQDGTRRILGYVPAQGERGFYISAGLSSAEAFSAIDGAARRGLIAIAASLVVALGAAWVVGEFFIARPARRILASADAWRGGDMTARTGLRAGAGDLGKIGDAFDRAVDAVLVREEALRETDAQLRALADNLPNGVVFQLKVKDGAARRFLYISEGVRRLLGLSPEEVVSDASRFYARMDPAQQAEFHAAEDAALRTGAPLSIETAVEGRGGERRWVLLQSAPRRLADGSAVWDGVLMDITESKGTEQRLRHLLDELNHRVKNTLAAVQSIAVQTLRRTEVPPDVFSNFQGRIFALGRAHDQLVRERWEPVEMALLVQGIFAPYEGEQIDVQGEPVRVPSRLALSLAMVLHELATNAAKYGSLSSPGGRLLLAWSVQNGGRARRLVIDWVETGGPTVMPSSRRGFGTRFVESSVTREHGGLATFNFDPAGLRCRLELQLGDGDDVPTPSP